MQREGRIGQADSGVSGAAMARVHVLLNRGGGAIKRDPALADSGTIVAKLTDSTSGSASSRSMAVEKNARP